MILLLFGSIAIPEIPITESSSPNGAQVLPASVDFQTPPAGAPTNKVLGSLGSSTMQFTLPDPALQESVLT